MSLFIRSRQINPLTRKRFGLVRVEGQFVQSRPGGPWVDCGEVLFTDPACPVTVCAATTSDYEAEGRRLLWNGLKTMLICWLLLKRDLRVIKEWERDSA